LRPRLTRSKKSRTTAITFELASFEYLRTGDSDVLLRLEGAWVADSDRGVPGAELRLLDGDDAFVVEPLPDPSNFPVAATRAGTPWAAAFPASLEEVRDGGVRFALVLTDGTRFDLPAPVDRDVRAAQAPVEEPQPVEEVPVLVEEAEPVEEPQPVDDAPSPIAALPEADRIKAIIAESIERFAVLEERIEQERAGREDAERRLAAAQAGRDEAATAVGGWTDVRAQLEESLADANADVAKLRTVLDVANAARKSAEDKLTARDHELEAARAEALASAQRVEELEAVLAQAEQAAGDRASSEHDLRDEFARRTREAEEAAAESAAALETAVGERGRAEARLAQLEAELAEAHHLASAEAMAREEVERQLETGEAGDDEILRHQLEQAREAAVRERGQRASFEQELKRRDDAEFDLRNTLARLEAEVDSLRAELASRDQAVAEWQRRVEETRYALEAAEAATADARVARAKLERDLRELSESGDEDDADTVLARHKAEMAELRSEIEAANGREYRAQRRIDELESALAEGGADAHRQQLLGEVDRLKAAAGRATQLAEQESKRRAELEEELQSRVVAEERLRAMLQAKVATARPDGEDGPDADIEVAATSVSGAAATSQGDFLERLADAKRKAAAVQS
jgi:chromosome segregation ATPase